MPCAALPPRSRRRGTDDGQISVLVLGLVSLVLLLVAGGVDVTAAQVARTRLLDASDAAALDAADALDSAAAYAGGLGASVTLSSATVADTASRHLAARPLPVGISEWRTAAGTGSLDGQSAAVVVEGVVDLPMSGGLLRALGGSVTITVESRATAPLR